MLRKFRNHEGTLFLHVGTHKTGTSAFQASLRMNQARLRRQGCFPYSLTAPSRRANGKTAHRFNVGGLADTFLRRDVVTFGRALRNDVESKADRRLADRAEILEDLKAVRQTNLIISAEAFCFLRTPEEKSEMRAFLDALERKVEVVVVLRNPEDWRASWENQLRKRPVVWKKIQSVEDSRRANGEWYFDRQAILDFWSDLGTVHVVDYDTAMAEEGNIVPAIYRAMDIDLRGLELEFRVNRRVELDERR